MAQAVVELVYGWSFAGVWVSCAMSSFITLNKVALNALSLVLL